MANIHSVSISTNYNNVKDFKEETSISSYVCRPALEMLKISAAIFVGALHGARKASDSICKVGAPWGAVCVLGGILLQSGKVNSPVFQIYDSYIKKPLTELTKGFLTQESQIAFVEVLTFADEFTINAPPREWFVSGLTQAACLNETIFPHSESEKKGAEVANFLETIAVNWNIVSERKHSNHAYAKTAAKLSSWISSCGIIYAAGEILRYALNPAFYTNKPFSDYVKTCTIPSIMSNLNFVVLLSKDLLKNIPSYTLKQ